MTALRANPLTWFRFSLAANVLAMLLVLFLTLPDSLVSRPKDYQAAMPAFLSSAMSYAGVGGHPGGHELEDGIDVASKSPAAAGACAAARCTMCNGAPEACEALGEEFMNKAVALEVSNARLRRFLSKLRRGEPYTVGVLGGSVSAGHGLGGPAPGITKSNMHRRIFDHLNARFPSPWAVEHAAEHAAAPADDINNSFGATIQWWQKDLSEAQGERKNAFVNGAAAGTGTNFFSACYRERIPEDVDLVLVEHAINDQFEIDTVRSYERTIRAVLDLPNQPAVINVHTVSLIGGQIALGGELQYGIASWYETPLITLRNPLLPQVMRNHSLLNDWYYNDGHWLDITHLQSYGHARLGDLVIAYIEKQLCEMDAIEAAAGTTDVDVLYPIEPLPRLLLTMRYDQTTTLPTFRPNCFTVGSPRSPLVPVAQSGWRQWSWGDKTFWIADEPGATISFPFTATAVGSVKLYYQRSRDYGLGSAQCWVDGFTAGAVRIDGAWDRPFSIGQDIAIHEYLPAGNHTLHCQILADTLDLNNGTEFRIISVFSY
ncbi:hypothetical protein Q5752_004235 [Cryptotrichosporon argae]